MLDLGLGSGAIKEANMVWFNSEAEAVVLDMCPVRFVSLKGKEAETMNEQPALKAMPQHEVADIPVYHTGVKMLGCIAILAVVGAIGLAAWGKQVPESIVVLGSISVGALAGLLAPSSGAK